jgi:hypothetical protein
MVDDPRHTLAGTLTPIGACVVVVSIVIAMDSTFSPFVRLLCPVAAIGVVLAATVYLRRVLRSRGRRVSRRAGSR